MASCVSVRTDGAAVESRALLEFLALFKGGVWEEQVHRFWDEGTIQECRDYAVCVRAYTPSDGDGEEGDSGEAAHDREAFLRKPWAQLSDTMKASIGRVVRIHCCMHVESLLSHHVSRGMGVHTSPYVGGAYLTSPNGSTYAVSTDPWKGWHFLITGEKAPQPGRWEHSRRSTHTEYICWVFENYAVLKKYVRDAVKQDSKLTATHPTRRFYDVLHDPQQVSRGIARAIVDLAFGRELHGALREAKLTVAESCKVLDEVGMYVDTLARVMADATDTDVLLDTMSRLVSEDYVVVGGHEAGAVEAPGPGAATPPVATAEREQEVQDDPEV